MREPKKERKKECIESHLTRFTFRGRSFRLNSLQFPVTQCGNFKPHHRTVPHTVCVFALSDQIRSDRILGGINQFECFHFVHKICRHLLHKPQSGLCMQLVQACACCHFQLHIHIQFRWPFCVKSCNFLWQPLNCVRLMTDKPARCF